MLVSNLKKQHAISLRRMFPTASFVGCADIHVSSLSADHRTCLENCLYTAIPGTNVDGNRFIEPAIQQGAKSLLSEHPHPNAKIPQCIVPNARAAYATLCHALYGMPGSKLTTIGVTGTNGKTTTAFLIRSILESAGLQTGLLGTVEYHDGVQRTDSELTTPDPAILARLMHQMVEKRTTHMVCELSSHAMHQSRTEGLGLDAAIITNITRDHLDYHKSIEQYQKCKFRILRHCKPQSTLIINGKDPRVRAIETLVPETINTIRFGTEDSTVKANILKASLLGTDFELQCGREKVKVFTHLIGQHNIENCMAAAGACLSLGVSLETIAKGISRLRGVRGRLESIDCNQRFRILVDYAHTDDALRRCLTTLRPLTHNRLICLFGAGGNRDRGKRPKLAAASELADLVIVTSDNPRTEDPDHIIADILSGFSEEAPIIKVEADRAEAIRMALDQAEAGDTVLIAGKGHESYQIIGTTRHDFDDHEIVKKHLQLNTLKMSA